MALPPNPKPCFNFGSLSFPFLLLLITLQFSGSVEISNKIGINYGRLGNNLPTPYQSIQHIRSMKAGRVKLFDANPEMLKLLSGTDLRVSITLPNHEIAGIAANQTAADNWVRDNILPYYPTTMIRFLSVGNQVLNFRSDQYKRIWPHLVPAMRRIKSALRAQNIANIKVASPMGLEVLAVTFPPSNATFRADISESVINPMLQFLNRTKSYLFIDVYPYFPWSANPTGISLDAALLRGNSIYTDPGSGLNYTNLLDQMLDAVVFASRKLGHPAVRLLISATGWPNGGDIIDTGANVRNAAIYNRNVVRKITARPAIGTPARPGLTIPTFLFSLYDENRKAGSGTERHWGMVNPTGEPIYEVDLTGRRLSSDYPPLPEAHNNRPYKGRVWCVVAEGASVADLAAAIGYACGQGNGTCGALAPGGECYEPVWVTWHASYAFSSYWSEFHGQGGSCYFSGLAQLTTTNPSSGSCQFPSVTV